MPTGSISIPAEKSKGKYISGNDKYNSKKELSFKRQFFHAHRLLRYPKLSDSFYLL